MNIHNLIEYRGLLIATISSTYYLRCDSFYVNFRESSVEWSGPMFDKRTNNLINPHGNMIISMHNTIDAEKCIVWSLKKDCCCRLPLEGVTTTSYHMWWCPAYGDSK